MEVTHGSAVRQFKLRALLYLYDVRRGEEGLPKENDRLREWYSDKEIQKS